jgi:putative ATPase
MAVDAAMADIKSGRVIPVPKHLRDAHYAGSEKLGHGEGYKYPHEFDGHFVKQDYLGVEKKYYVPSDIGYESKIKTRIEYWDNCRKNALAEGSDEQ